VVNQFAYPVTLTGKGRTELIALLCDKSVEIHSHLNMQNPIHIEVSSTIEAF